jgi:glycosyltransferase involved in cell wall biosynthesis
MVQQGHSVTVLTGMPNYPTGKIYPGYTGLWRREQIDGVRILRTFIYPTQKADMLRRLANYLSFVLSSGALGSFLLPKSDYLLVESPPLFLGIAGVWLSRITGARLIFNVSDLWPESAVQLGLLKTGSTAFKLSGWLESFCYRHAWLVTGQSKSILSHISARFPECHIFHLSNGVDTERFGPAFATEGARAVLTQNGDCVALYAGLHGLAQGLDQIVATAEMMQSEKGIRFVLVGDGPLKKTLMEQSRRVGLSNLAFLPPRPTVEIPSLVAAADMVLVPLKKYIPGAVPSKLYEAMASNRPVVLIASGEAADIVREHNAGIVVVPGDREGLIRAIRLLQSDPELRRRLGRQGRLAAEKLFDRRTIICGFLQYLRTITETV